MDRIRLVATALSAVALLAVACRDNGASNFVVSQPTQTGISVSGQGRITAVPDIALLTLGVEVTAPTVAAARAAAAGAMKAVRASLDANAIRSDDIKTLTFNIQPQYHYRREEKPEISGYTVSNRVSVKVRDLDRVSEVLDDAAETGGDAVRISSIAFTVDEPERYEDDAREAAVEDARRRAEQLAALAGVRLGKVLSISESGASIPLMARSVERVMLAAADAPPTPISPGETEIALSVFVVYAIE